ncbi:hypothetical protein RRK67_000255 [Vibrio fluvialis]|nr:hypothetical protein [Vibrio fluvialis]ELI5717184.1 hypothetical protein [Vibrio fluvialis]
MDEFLGFRRRERLKSSRPTTTKPKALSGYSLCQQRVTGASHRKPPISLNPKRDKPHPYHQKTKNDYQFPFPKNKKRPSTDGLSP